MNVCFSSRPPSLLSSLSFGILHLIIIPCGVQLQHFDDSDSFSACLAILVFP